MRVRGRCSLVVKGSGSEHRVFFLRGGSSVTAFFPFFFFLIPIRLDGSEYIVRLSIIFPLFSRGSHLCLLHHSRFVSLFDDDLTTAQQLLNYSSFIHLYFTLLNPMDTLVFVSN
jgi:hypothetical protein